MRRVVLGLALQIPLAMQVIGAGLGGPISIDTGLAISKFGIKAVAAAIVISAALKGLAELTSFETEVELLEAQANPRNALRFHRKKLRKLNEFYFNGENEFLSSVGH